mmetsp:Transcript_4303/g.7549  ORF Transcript_4303/g.7549 Transcript_4303/m.7549 type:complete len:361 (-) Transcript_4303:730-1812(-)
MHGNYVKCEDEMKTIRSEVEKIKLELNVLDDERKKKALLREHLMEKLEMNRESLNRAHSKLKSLKSFMKSTQEEIEVVLEKHSEWIEHEIERRFASTDHVSIEFLREELLRCETEFEKKKNEEKVLGMNINRRAMNAYEKAHQEYQELSRKKDIVVRDKQQIEDVIAMLDQKKLDALESTWRKVNADFSSIFSTLLPGAICKLSPPLSDQHDTQRVGNVIENGLQIQVGFGGVWKDSLSELSGGQRSLIALSLILSLLRYKPAPMYILDEVDSALDLSHTQNIGSMIKAHFHGSQFIVVSLKEGMFNHADVVFRTKFVDGISTVLRTTNSNPVQEQKHKRKLIQNTTTTTTTTPHQSVLQ